MKHLSLVALAAALLPAATTLAKTSASASLGPLVIQLVDLDPLDGVTPSVSNFRQVGGWGLPDPYGSWVAQAYVGYPRPEVRDTQRLGDTSPWAPGSVSAQLNLVQATTSVAGSGSVAGTTLSSSGSSGDRADNQPHFVAYLSTFAGESRTIFTLSANTELIISAFGSLSAQGDTSFAGPGARNYDYVAAGVGMHVGENVFSPTWSSDVLSYQNSTRSGTINSFNYSEARSFAVSFANRSGDDMSGQIRAFTDVSGLTSAVPEPGTWALLLAGLALVGGLAGRRSST